MILDALATLEAGVPFDTDAIRPGPGEPIVLFAAGQTPGALITVTTDADDGAGAPAGAPSACTTATVDVDGSVQFEVPSSAKQWIVSDVECYVVLKGGQTNL